MIQPNVGAIVVDSLHPNFLVQAAFYLSVFSIPFCYLYLPGTGERVGVARLVQLLIFLGALSQPRVCLRFFPKALFWFVGYVFMRMIWGLWLTPDLAASWWPDDLVFIGYLFPWTWVLFNVLQFPDMRQRGVWVLTWGCLACAICHIAGIGVDAAFSGAEGRSSVFGQNPNEVGATYATAVIALFGLWTSQAREWIRRLLPVPMMALIGIALAKTGSRGAILILAIGLLVLLFASPARSKIKHLASLLVFVTALAATLWQMPTVMTRFQEINPQNIGENNPRARMAPVLWEMFLRSPVYGLGPDGYQWELTRRALPYLIKERKLIDSHNEVLLLLVETGLIGFLLFSTGVAMALAGAWRAWRRAADPLPLALLLPIVIAAATVANPAQHLIFWLAMAYGLTGNATAAAAPRA
jgi:O-antigen ligase